MHRFLTYIFLLFFSISALGKIDRHALVTRNNPHITTIDTLASLSVGNGEFAFTADVTGLQTFHSLYKNGVPLGTMAQWGWHSFPNVEGYKAEDVLKEYDFGRGHKEWYSCQLKDERGKKASDYLRANPHRLHLGIIAFKGIIPQDISNIDQTLNLWDGVLSSSYRCRGQKMKVQTSCDASQDMVVASIQDKAMHKVEIKFPYPTGNHSDDACDWSDNHEHTVSLVSQDNHCAIYQHTLDNQSYFIKLCWTNAAQPIIDGHSIVISPDKRKWAFSVEFINKCPDTGVTDFENKYPDTEVTDFEKSVLSTKEYWHDYWNRGGAVDFSHCTNPLARELERRTVLSQYLLAIQCAGSTPPQETGLTYNSWFGKFHLEMTWWHMAHFALWNHPEMLERTLPWYEKAAKKAAEIAKRQNFEGIRWMKMTDPSGNEAPSNVGSFLIWQQPHFIYLADLTYRARGDFGMLHQFYPLVEKTADFMASFATFDEKHKRYILKGCIPAQETLKAADTVNPPFELSYWRFALSIAQEWRKRLGMEPKRKWDDVIEYLSPLAEKDGIYAAAESAPSYPSLIPQQSEADNSHLEAQEIPENLRLYSDHMAVLCAFGVLPRSQYLPQFDVQTMSKTLDWVLKNWNWNKTWGWDYPTTAMTAVRCGEPEKAIQALLMDKRTNTYLPNGHNYQDQRLRCYLPGNGGFLTTIALMCAGYEGCTTPLPGFPKDGTWDVRYENIMKSY